MTSLIICLSTGKGTWAQVSKVINSADWEKVYLITNRFGAEKFSTDKESEFIIIDDIMPISETAERIRHALDGKIRDLEVAVNVSSGTGYEHMAIISAVLKLGVGLRLVYAEGEKLIDL